MIVANVNNSHLLEKPIVGRGGFQNLMARLQNGFDKGRNTVTMSEEDQKRIVKAIDKCGQGGWQDRLLKVFF